MLTNEGVEWVHFTGEPEVCFRWNRQEAVIRLSPQEYQLLYELPNAIISDWIRDEAFRIERQAWDWQRLLRKNGAKYQLNIQLSGLEHLRFSQKPYDDEIPF